MTQTKTVRKIRIQKVQLGDVTTLHDFERIILGIKAEGAETFYLVIQTESYEPVVK